MQIAGESVEDMAKKFKVRLDPVPCAKCGKVMPFTSYEFDFGYLIFYAEMHECGEKYRTKIAKPISKKEKEKWAEIAQSM